ncbi:hypothetical protein DVH24_014732 [Malus domestica]|uniref:Mitochondrial inner membrane protease subunit 2 n=1 Tax=Malus domestica TaxID=3750 RepID=A0A498K6S9_MALDO|nr:hypothetical protein DVH24_014732 [Malus domestica]
MVTFSFPSRPLGSPDRFASVAPVRGSSMSPTLNPGTTSLMGLPIDDYVLVEKRCLQSYKFSHGDVVVFRSPSNHKESHIKRITALPGEWIGTRRSYDVVKIPEGHCWVEGDNSSSSLDSKSFGPIPLGLVQGRVTHIVWPPQRMGAVERITPQDTISSLFVTTLEENMYSCKHCRTHLGLVDDVISKSFHCRHGKAYLFDKVVNVTLGEQEERIMITGLHTVADIFCVSCGSNVGWKYEAAHEKSQKYKEGKFILERFQILGPDGSNYSIALEAQIGGSDQKP